MLLVSAGTGIGLSAIPIYTLGVFIGPLGRDMGWPAPTIVLGSALTSLIIALASPFGGILLDRWGARPMVLAGATIQSCSIASLALLTPSLWLYFALWGALGVGGVLASPVVWLRPVVERFVAHRGMATSFVFCGSNLAGVITPVLAAYLVLHYGWRSAYLGLGFYMAVSGLPLAVLFLRDSKTRARKQGEPAAAAAAKDYGLETKAAMRDRHFWLMVPSFFLTGVGITGFIVHLVPMLTQRGVAPLLAASAVSALSVSAIPGRLTSGFLVDRLFAPWIASFTLFLPVLASAALLFAESPFWPGLAAAILIGLSVGGEIDMISYLVSRYFGMRSYGKMSGLMFGMFTLGCLLGPPFVALTVTMSGDYRAGQFALAAAFGTASIIMLFCRAYPKFTPVER